MIAESTAPVRRRPRQTGFSGVASAARLHLCKASRDDEAVRNRHIAALLAFTPTVERTANQMRITFEDGSTAMWAYGVLPKGDVELAEVGKDGGVIVVTNPQMVLGPYGFRDGRWVFGQGMGAALGISRGAVHAAGTFNKHGLKVACPNTPMMLTLTAVMTRLGITAKPTEGEPRAAISAGDVPAALDRLGIAEVADAYQQLRDSNVVRKNA
ncbi:hypothetical protein [Mycobacterium sp. SMC-13]|uniref:hypothetical protein n=1 Tax=Mycobacterium sp. SMC-13 TaxID=3381626 RepID=UPI003875D74E